MSPIYLRLAWKAKMASWLNSSLEISLRSSGSFSGSREWRHSSSWTARRAAVNPFGTVFFCGALWNHQQNHLTNSISPPNLTYLIKTTSTSALRMTKNFHQCCGNNDIKSLQKLAMNLTPIFQKPIEKLPKSSLKNSPVPSEYLPNIPKC